MGSCVKRFFRAAVVGRQAESKIANEFLYGQHLKHWLRHTIFKPSRPTKNESPSDLLAESLTTVVVSSRPGATSAKSAMAVNAAKGDDPSRECGFTTRQTHVSEIVGPVPKFVDTTGLGSGRGSEGILRQEAAPLESNYGREIIADAPDPSQGLQA